MRGGCILGAVSYDVDTYHKGAIFKRHRDSGVATLKVSGNDALFAAMTPECPKAFIQQREVPDRSAEPNQHGGPADTCLTTVTVQ